MIYKCKMCGGSLSINENETIVVCEYCGTKQTLPRLDSEKKASLLDRADHFRRSNEYDKAMSIYEQILADEKDDAEIYWLIVLCRYGIEYIEDPTSHKRIPTVNRVQYNSILNDEDYLKALELADNNQKKLYIEEANKINDIQKGILEVSSKEEPFDIFICYKETDDNGRRTEDSVIAQDIYKELTNEGYKVFFSRITLEDKIGTAYEPYIFAALNTTKVMLVIGTKKEYFNAVWVKNEWSRYLALINKGEKKLLVPCYKNIDPYDLPEEFAYLQAQDLNKLGYMQDLIRGIEKIVHIKDDNISRIYYEKESNSDIKEIKKSAYMFLNNSEYEYAFEEANKIIKIAPNDADAYLIRLLSNNKIKNFDQLLLINRKLQNANDYKNYIKYADKESIKKIDEYNNKLYDIKQKRKRKTIIIIIIFFSLAITIQSIRFTKKAQSDKQLRINEVNNILNNVKGMNEEDVYKKLHSVGYDTCVQYCENVDYQPYCVIDVINVNHGTRTVELLVNYFEEVYFEIKSIENKYGDETAHITGEKNWMNNIVLIEYVPHCGLDGNISDGSINCDVSNGCVIEDDGTFANGSIDTGLPTGKYCGVYDYEITIKSKGYYDQKKIIYTKYDK